jgi:hypothetical protein
MLAAGVFTAFARHMPTRLLSVVEGEAEATRFPDDAAKEADHRIGNSLTIIAGLIRSEANKIPSETSLSGENVRLLLQGISARIDELDACIAFSNAPITASA